MIPNWGIGGELARRTIARYRFYTMLSREEVLKIAKLARLTLSEDEVALYQKRLGRVLDYIRDLNQLDTPKDAFVRHIPQDAVGFREDKPTPFSNAPAILENAPAKEEGCFLLPTVLDQS